MKECQFYKNKRCNLDGGICDYPEYPCSFTFDDTVGTLRIDRK